MHDVAVTTTDLILVITFCRTAVFPCKWKMEPNASIYNYYVSEDLKYMDINQENKIY